MDRAQLSIFPPLSETSPAQRVCPGKSIHTTEAACQIFPAQPRAALTGKDNNGEDKRKNKTRKRRRREKKMQQAQNQRTNFTEVFSREMTSFLGRRHLYPQWDGRFMQPTCLERRHAGRTRGGKFVSLEASTQSS